MKASHGNVKAAAQGASAFLRKHTHWGHYASALGIVISLHWLVTHLGWYMGLSALVLALPAALYGFIRWKRFTELKGE